MTRLDHIGIAVRSLASAKIYEDLGLTIDHVETVETQRVKTAFLSAGDSTLELLEPTSPDSPIAKFIEKRGEGIHHICLRVVNLISPKEKFFGVLRALSPAGVTMRAVNLDSFDDWIHQIARAEEAEIEMVTMFVPLFRVERIFLDESAGMVQSYSQRFAQVVGQNVAEYLELPAS